MEWGELLTSEVAVTLYVTVALFAYRWSRDHFKWNSERWEGLVANAFLIAEKSNAAGSTKLGLALKVFNEEYAKTYGKPPSPMDLKDAALDFGRLALEHKFGKAV